MTTKAVTIKELLYLCKHIAGMTILELANSLNITPPISLKNNKGWVGQLLEQYLGVSSGNLPIADFPHLGLELKTIPINSKTKQPLESTFVCTATFNQAVVSWEQSIVKLKLSKVLWIPIEVTPEKKLTSRRIGAAFLWQPTIDQLKILQQDWQELTEMLQLGNIQSLSAKYGQYLQIRPKALNCKTNLVKYLNINKETIQTVARGFYLRTSFTKNILANHFVC
jgi:DNA mismatch repair protein MutH